MDSLYAGIADIFEIDPAEVTAETELDSGGWDSLAMVSTIALFDELFGREVDINALKRCRTVADIEALASA